MNIDFHQLPARKREGGIDLATTMLRGQLSARGHAVRVDPTEKPKAADLVSVAHFHGLWWPRHSQIANRLRQLNRPYLVSPHGMLEPWAWRHKWWKKWPYFLVRERPYLRRAFKLLATSQKEADHLSRFFPVGFIEVLPPGLPSSPPPDYAAARQRLGWGEKEIVLLFLSRVHFKKGLHLLIQALTRLDSADKTGMRLVIVGGGERDYLAQVGSLAAASAGSLPRIEWKGEVWGEERWPYFQGADLFCLPSYSENFGFAVLEALQVGTRALVTDTTPWETLENKDWRAGFVCRPEVESVVEALKKYLDAQVWKAEDRSALARTVQDHYGWSTLVGKYEGVYEQALRSVKRPQPMSS